MTQTYETLDRRHTSAQDDMRGTEAASTESAAPTAPMPGELTPQQRVAVEMRRRQILMAQAVRRANLEKEREKEQRHAAAERTAASGSPALPVSVVVTAKPQSDGRMSLRSIQGSVLRELRTRDHRTLREVSQKAGVSLGYLSEVERGQKEASSELLVSITKALGVPLSQVLMMIARRVEDVEKAQEGSDKA